jgi:competence protein ComEA
VTPALLLAILLAAPPAPPASLPGFDEVRPKANAPSFVIDINQATAEDFQKLPGIGPALAGRIVAYRKKHGPFRRVEDLLVVRGIGHKKWKAIRPYLKVGGEAGKK